jgi:hypothetical protein
MLTGFIVGTTPYAGNTGPRELTHCLTLGIKKIPVVSVSYCEKIRVGRSEIIFFKNIFSWFWQFFAGQFAV